VTEVVTPMRIRTKRIYEQPDPADGRRILIDRLWPGLADLRQHVGKGTVTLLYSSTEQRLNNATALQEYLENRPKGT